MRKIMEDSEDHILLFNTLTRKKEPFVPIEKGKVKMYTCGPTVYDFAHIGNFRTFIFQDLLKRWLKYRGFNVTHVMNITDVDDKTIRNSRKKGVTLKQYTDYYMKAFFEDLKILNIERAEHYPRATDHIPEMVALIKQLMEKGYAYMGEDGSIYFDISKFKDYGKLSKLKIDELKPGVRVKVDEYGKEEVQDFALWKAWDEEDGDVYWETELGKGRPGWHVECSAMAMKYLGETIDIHSGGVDLIFPHHENEIAQSEAATGKPFARYWLHSEHLLVEGKRMSKSLGNFYTLRDLTAKGYDPMAIRFLLLSTHYRQQLNFTFDGLEAAGNAVSRLRNFVHRLLDANGRGCGKVIKQLMENFKKSFESAMDDDLNISVALAALFDFVRDVNKLLDEQALSRDEALDVYELMMRFNRVLGIMDEGIFKRELPKEAEELIRKREEARKVKDWKTADQIREQLRAMGIIIEDTPQGVKWRIERKTS
ncbi:MAG: cysteine--tRNA ligase [Nitrososphaerota archaeon]|nr:cysteine--tRNA ligase [Candidatus Bathyarchaeota archaeon]MDW8194156.1 cysteine--tRNA ligase [Nitrososphaerota archaeon]